MAEPQTHVFRVSLGPKLYRDFEILSAKSLYDLAELIVQVFGFDLDHAFGFYSKLSGQVFDSPVRYELFADIGESDAGSVKRTRIVEAFPGLVHRIKESLKAGTRLTGYVVNDTFAQVLAGKSGAHGDRRPAGAGRRDHYGTGLRIAHEHGV